MFGLDKITTPFPGWVILGLGIALAGQTARLFVEQAEHKESVATAKSVLDKEKLDRSNEKNKALELYNEVAEKLRVAKLAMENLIQENEIEALKKKQAADAVIATGRNDVKRLSGIIAAYTASSDQPPADLAQCTSQLARAKAKTNRTGEILQACVAEYRQLGEDADGIDLLFDTSLNYINVVNPLKK